MRRTGIFLAVILTAGLVAACAPPNTGISGSVDVGPACPQGASVDCPKPLPVRVAVADERGDPLTSVSPSAEGIFKIDLAPGTYIVQALRGSGLEPQNMGAPVVVKVIAGRYSQVKLAFSGPSR
jgi:hypothetical protein